MEGPERTDGIEGGLFPVFRRRGSWMEKGASGFEQEHGNTRRMKIGNSVSKFLMKGEKLRF